MNEQSELTIHKDKFKGIVSQFKDRIELTLKGQGFKLKLVARQIIAIEFNADKNIMKYKVEL